VAKAEATGRSASGLVPGDGIWALILLVVIGLLVLHNFAWGGGPVPELALGPLRISNFGLLAALGLLFGVYLVHRWCVRFGLDWQTLQVGLIAILLSGGVFAHLVSIAAYYPQKLFDPRVLFDLGSGNSLFGGMLGGALSAIVFLRRRGLPSWRYIDPLVYGLVGGNMLGRAGCFAIHDHPGKTSDFFMAVEIGGIRRHDLGFYEIWLMLALFVGISWWARQRRPADGAVLALAATVYAPVRFLFDCLRVKEITYAGLTPGQWFALPLFAVGAWALVRLVRGQRREGRRPEPPPF